MPQPRYRLYTRARTYATIAAELANGRWRHGDTCSELESAMQGFGAANAVCAPRARTAIYLALRAILQPGQKVVLSPYTIADVINMVVCAGGVPVFADIERETGNIDAGEVEKLADADTGAVFVTHLHGLACDLPRLSAFCTDRGLPLVEDAAQALGAKVGGRRVGTVGDAGIFSFGMYKNVNAFLGGMVVTPHGGIAERIRAEVKGWPLQHLGGLLPEVAKGLATDLATWPPLFGAFTYHVFRYAFLHELSFFNKQVSFDDHPTLLTEMPDRYLRRMTPLQARLVLGQLADVDANIERRVAYAKRYHEGLSDLPELRLPPLRSDGSHMYTYYPIQVEARPAFLREMMRQGRDVAAQHIKNTADMDCFRAFHRDCPNARATADALVLLPTYPRYGEREVDRNVEAIRRIFGSA